VEAKKGRDRALKGVSKFFSTTSEIIHSLLCVHNKVSNPTGGTSTTGKKPAVNPESTANVHPLTNEQNPENIIVKLLNQMFATQDPKERQELFEIAFKEAEAEPGLLESLAKAVENILGHNNTLSYPY
jgi:hypothetical protein